MIMRYVTGNLVRMALTAMEHNFPTAFAHGCNCHDAMHSGIAWEFQRAIPEVRAADREMYQHHIENDLSLMKMLGSYSTAEVGTIKVFNLYTQFYPGKDCRYDAIRSAFEEIDKREDIISLLIPRLGAGVAGGDWNLIEQIINESTPNTHIIVVDWDGTVFDDEAIQ